MSDREQQRVQRLPNVSAVWVLLSAGVLGTLVDLATGPSAFEITTLFWVGSFGVSIGGITAALACVLFGVWEAWYR